MEDASATYTTCQKDTANINRGILYSGHMSTGNYLFVDGHVKWLRPMATLMGPRGNLPSSLDQASQGMWTLREDD